MHLHFVGDISSKDMLGKVQSMTREYGLENYVHVEGGKKQSICRQYGRNSIATLLVSDLNCGNVFFEVMSEGCVLLTNNSHSLDEFIEDEVNCLVYEQDDYSQAAEKIISLLKEPEKMKDIRSAAYLTAKEKFLSLERRFDLEASLVEAAAKGGDLSQFPPVL
jgi:glycosyltransferase involved in cell wall biosynthesis